MKIFGYTKDEIQGKTSLGLNVWPTEAERRGFVKKLIHQGGLENEEVKEAAKDAIEAIESRY